MRKLKSLFQIILIVGMMFAFVPTLADNVSATNVCCEQTKSGDYCQYVDEASCAAGSKMTPTSCEQTAFCDTGCCYDRDGEGYCYSGYPRATCEKQYSGIFNSEDNCDAIPECEKGCCIIGTQAAFVTENRCKSETKKFADLAMDFRPNIKTEKECIKEASRSTYGCCVSPQGSCTYVTAKECNFQSENISVAVNATEQKNNSVTLEVLSGFYSNKYCSQVGFCDCTPANPEIGGKGLAKDTACLAGSDDVWYLDSCGNPEGVAQTCNYAEGYLCGDSDKDGRTTCEDISCVSLDGNTGNEELLKFKDAYWDYEQVKEQGILNGESWCMYDYAFYGNPVTYDYSPDIKGGETDGGIVSDYGLDEDSGEIIPLQRGATYDDYRFKLDSISTRLRDVTYASREPVGARHYRAICINGQQLVEPCADYRKEWCLEGTISSDESGGRFVYPVDYTQSRCVENRWQSCVDDCNTATPDLSGSDWEEAQKKDIACCADYSMRDCAWIQGKCVPRIDPGTRFWEKEGENNCGKANMECTFLVKCDGWSNIFGGCANSDSSGMGWMAAGWYPINSAGDKISLSDVSCFSDEDRDGKMDFIQAANNLCRSYGDCGASYNLAGKYTYEGFTSPESLGGRFSELIGDRLKEAQINSKNKPDWTKGYGVLDTRLKGASYDGVFRDWFVAEAGTNADWKEGMRWTTVSTILASGLLASLEVWPQTFGTSFLSGTVFGFTDASQAEMDKVIASQVEKLGPEELAKKGAESLGEEAVQKIRGEIVDRILAQTATDMTTESGRAAAQKQVQEQLTAQLQKEGEKSLASHGWVGTALEVYNVAMWVYMVYDLINTFAADTQTVSISTTCGPWVAPKTTDDCEKCNPDYWMDENGNALDPNAYKACSEYRCKSFGATCELINKGTEEERCVSQGAYDTNSPVIKPWIKGFDVEYKDSIQPFSDNVNSGFEITKEIPIYQRITLGIETDEPSQCKMSFNHSKKYDEMSPIYFGGTTFEYFHKQSVFYPASLNVTQDSLHMLTSGEYNLYVRCVDAVGNANDADYVIRYAVGKEPDLTAPVIEQADISQESYLSAHANETPVTLYVSEPAKCKWSLSPLSYDDMGADKDCATSATPDGLGYYECRFDGDKKIKGLSSVAGETKYLYFKCRDVPAGNTNKEPYTISLKGSSDLNITSIYPTGTLELAKEDQYKITLGVKTSGGALGDGSATCKYTRQESLQNNFNAMDDELVKISGDTYEKELTLPSGTQIVYAGCVDAAGNSAFAKTEFTLLQDDVAPKFIKSYWKKGEVLSNLAVEIDEDGTCESGSRTFAFGEGSLMLKDGIVHETTDQAEYYYVICQDVHNNTQSSPTLFRRVK